MIEKNRDIEFLFEIGKMRMLQRTWQRFFLTNVANDVEHTFRVMWLALIIAKREGNVDEQKMMKMALVHDITESRTGDVDYLSRQYSERNEEMAICDILGGTSLEDEFLEIWKEYEKRESIEAKIVKDADNLDVDMELMEQKDSNLEVVGLKSGARKEAIPKKLFTDTAKKMFDEIYQSNIHDWHFNSDKNRHRGGDWNGDKK